MRLFGKTTIRQKEIRRSKAERRGPWLQRLNQQVHVGSLLFLLAGAAACAWVVNVGEDILDLRVGQRIPRAMTARITYRVADERATDRMRTQARDNADRYYELDLSLLQDIRGRLMNGLRIAREYAADPAKLRDKAAEIRLLFDDTGLEEIVRLAAQADSQVYDVAVDRTLRALRNTPLVEASELAQRRTGIKSILVDPEQTPAERTVLNSELYYPNNAEHVNAVVQAVVAAADFTPPLRETMRQSLTAMLRGDSGDAFKPLYRFDTRRSAKAAQDAEAAVETQYNVYPAGTRLAEAGILTKEALERLREEYQQYRHPDLAMQSPETLAVLREAQRLEPWGRAARAALAFLIVVSLGAYLSLVHPEVLGSTRRHVATAITLVLVLALSRAAYLATTLPHLAVGAYALAIALLAITSGRGSAYATGGLLALMVTLTTRQGIGFLVVLVAVAMVLFLRLRSVRNRGRIIAAGALAALTAGVVTQLLGLTSGQWVTFVFWNQTLWAVLTTLAAAFLVEGILPTIERLFDVTTDMTLLEWCDPNKPLLRMLAAESPGTYNHSLLVGTLADAAAEAIGANGLLARTGAYYHDIGKINKPEYFVENQVLGVGSRHERLSPAMSHLIIIGHVKDGIEMAKAYHLPRRLHAFIPEHHGTCVVEYFYHAASRARKPGDPAISDQQFRYPGPKPQSRETAIVMLCDAVEGAVRAMSDPMPNRIEDTVDRMIQKRMMDGQFDDCDMTFRELQTIRNSLVKTLASIYHARITYPSAEQPPETRSAS